MLRQINAVTVFVIHWS